MKFNMSFFHCSIFLPLLLFVAQDSLCLKYLTKLSEEERKENARICGLRKDKSSNYKFPWAVRIRVELDGTFDENGDTALNQCGGVLLSNRHVLSIAHCFFNYKLENGAQTPDYTHKNFTVLSKLAPIVDFAWNSNSKNQFMTKKAAVGAWHQSFMSKGRSDVNVYYSYFNWALLQLEQPVSQANDTAQLWKEGKIAPICIPDPETRPDPEELSVFGFGKHEQCPQGETSCITESNTTIVDCMRPNFYSLCINTASNKPQIGTTDGAGFYWTMPKSSKNALMSMELFRDHSSNILHSTRVKKRQFSQWIKDWTNVDSIYDKPMSGAIVASIQAFTRANKICPKLQKSPCFVGPLIVWALRMQIGSNSIPDKSYRYLMQIDTGTAHTFVFNTETVLFEIYADGTLHPVSADDIYEGDEDLPEYIPMDLDKTVTDSFTLGGGSENYQNYKLNYYKDQFLYETFPETPKLNLHMGVVSNYSERANLRPQGTWGLLGLGLNTVVVKDPENVFMNRFRNQRSLKPVVSFDLKFTNGKYDLGRIGIGTSLISLPTTAITTPIHLLTGLVRHWVVVATMRIKFPSKDTWVANNIFGLLDTGTQDFSMTTKVFDQIVMAGQVQNPEIYHSQKKFDCDIISGILPEIELDFMDKQHGHIVTIKVDKGKLYEKWYNPKTPQITTEQCYTLISLNPGHDFFIFGIPVFAASYIVFNYEKEEISINNKK